MKPLLKIKWWSNLFFLIPFLVSLQWEIFWYAFIIGLTFIISCAYHYTDEKHWIKLDVFFASSLIISNLILLGLGNLNPLQYTSGSVAFALFAGLFYYRQAKHGYNLNHGLYHVASAIICILCLIIFQFN